MAKLSINVMGIEDEKREISLIMQNVSRMGRLIIPVKSNPDEQILMASKLVIYKVLKISVIEKEGIEYYEYSIGENFAKANLKGAYDFIKEENKNLNPSVSKKIWKLINENQLISGIIIGILTTFVGGLLLWYFTK